MSVLDREASSVQLIREVVVGLVAIHNAFVWLLHMCYTSVSAEKKKIHSLSVYALTLTSISSLSYMIVPWFTSFKSSTSWNLNLTLTDSACRWMGVAMKLLYLYPRSIGLYVVYFERLFYIFSDSAYAFKPAQKYLLRVLLMVPTIFFTVLIYINSEEGYNLDANWPDTNTCTIAFTRNGMILTIAVDAAICNLLSFLYCRRLLIFRSRLATGFLAHGANPGGPGAANPPPAELVALNRIFKLMMKSTLLQFMATLTSQASMIAMAVMGVPSIWAALDSMVNCWCLVLMFDIYDELFRLYPLCCGLCEKLMCYHCIVCYSCHCCCRVNYGEIPRPQIEMS